MGATSDGASTMSTRPPSDVATPTGGEFPNHLSNGARSPASLMSKSASSPKIESTEKMFSKEAPKTMMRRSPSPAVATKRATERSPSKSETKKTSARSLYPGDTQSKVTGKSPTSQESSSSKARSQSPLEGSRKPPLWSQSPLGRPRSPASRNSARSGQPARSTGNKQTGEIFGRNTAERQARKSTDKSPQSGHTQSSGNDKEDRRLKTGVPTSKVSSGPMSSDAAGSSQATVETGREDGHQPVLVRKASPSPPQTQALVFGFKPGQSPKGLASGPRIPLGPGLRVVRPPSALPSSASKTGAQPEVTSTSSMCSTPTALQHRIFLSWNAL